MLQKPKDQYELHDDISHIQELFESLEEIVPRTRKRGPSRETWTRSKSEIGDFTESTSHLPLLVLATF
jgi:hypothetical protein